MAVTSVVIPQSPVVSNATILAAAARTADGTAGPWPVDFFSSAEIVVAVTTCSGTLNVYLQKLLPDNATYDDIASFDQWTTAVYTTSGTFVLSFVNAGENINQQGDAALAVNTINTVHFGSAWRIKYVIAGTGATANFGVYGNFRQ